MDLVLEVCHDGGASVSSLEPDTTFAHSDASLMVRLAEVSVALRLTNLVRLVVVVLVPSWWRQYREQ